jgi:hypothetical protein
MKTETAREYLEKVWLFGKPEGTLEVDEVVELMEEYAKYRVKCEVKKLHEPNVSKIETCDHDWRHGFTLSEGSYTWCAKCKQRYKDIHCET